MMSKQVAQDSMEGVRDSLAFSLSLITLFTLPAITGLVLCAKTHLCASVLRWGF